MLQTDDLIYSTTGTQQDQHPVDGLGASSMDHHHHLPQGYPFYPSPTAVISGQTARTNKLDDYGGHQQHQLHNNNQSGGLHTGILEMRKEKSRDAARSRRGKENYEFYELAKMLPLPPAITSQLDKASIIRLTISFLRLKDFSSNGDPPWIKDHPSSGSNSSPTTSSSASNSTSSSSNSSTKATKGGRSRGSQQQQHNQNQLNHHHHLQQHHQQQHIHHNPGMPGASIHVELFDQHQGTHILQSLDGFAFSLGSDGRFLYISETVSIYLGLSQVEMTGSSVFDYVHTADHSELAQQLGLTLASTSSQPAGSSSSAVSQQLPPSPASGTGSVDDGSSSMNPDVTSLMSLESNSAYQGLDRSFCIRMKSTLTKRGCHFKSSGYRVVMVLCRLRPQSQHLSSGSKTPGGGSQQIQPGQPIPLLGMIAMAIALPPPTVHEVRLEPDMFVTRLSFDLRIVHCEPRISELLEFVAEDLTGRSLYTLCHAEDVRLLRKAHTDLMHKGQVMTPYYRILNRHGGFTWLQSCATVVCNSKSGDEQSIVCVNYVLSRTEMKNLIVDQCQLESAPAPPLIPMKSGGFKVLSTADTGSDLAGSPEDSSSDSESTSNIGKSSSVRTNESRPSSGDVDDGSGAADEANSSGRITRNRQQNRTSKRKYEDLSGVQHPAGDVAVSSGSLDHHHHLAEANPNHSGASNSNEGAGSIQLMQSEHPDHQQHSEAMDAARAWKRLYAGMDQHHNESIQDRDLEANGGGTDFSADTLISGNKQRSTIQWIGGAPPIASSSSSSSSATSSSSTAAAAALSVPSLLRQLYASRESVIRANVHAAAAAAAAGRSTASGYHFSNGENASMSGPLGNGGDYQSDVFPSSSAYHSAAAVAAAASSTAFLPEYLPAMTPPSSVSPRDAAAAGALFASAEASLRHYGADSSYVATALKPHHHHHVYGHGSMDHHHHQTATHHHQYTQPSALVSSAVAAADAGQFYSHHHHATTAGFHLYHPQVSGNPNTKSAPSTAAVANNSSAAATWYPN